MRYLAVKLIPKSFIHLGEREKWLEGSRVHIPSDTLFSALCHCFLLLYGEVEDLLQGFISGDAPFLISSAFPWWDGDFYFPLPKNQLAFGEKLAESSEKDLKQVRYVNQVLLIRLLSGENLSELVDEIKSNFTLKCLPDLGRYESKNKNLAEKDLPTLSVDYEGVAWRTEDVPRVALNRFNNHPGENFFHFGQVAYADRAGLFVLVMIKKKEWLEKIKALFRLLADEGIGGDRSCGKGLFRQPEFLEVEFPEIESVEAEYALSCYFPRENEITGLDESYYELEERKGYIFSPLNRSFRRRSLRVFTEGSVFKGGISRVGRLVDTKPEVFDKHPVYRYGYLFSIPCRMEPK